MIEINLLPRELRVKSRENVSEQASLTVIIESIRKNLFICVILILLGAVVLGHIYLTINGMLKKGNLASLERKWADLAGQRKILDEFNQQYSAASGDAGLVQLFINQRVLWARKLNRLSLNLPSGIWFNDLTLGKQGLVIQGSVISLQKDELALINKLLDSLRSDQEFSKDFSNFEINGVQKRVVGSYEIADFVLTGACKAN